MTHIGETCRICSAIFSDFEEKVRYLMRGIKGHTSQSESSPHSSYHVVVKGSIYLSRLNQQRLKARAGLYERCFGDFANCTL
jgi:hypothetical protein